MFNNSCRICLTGSENLLYIFNDDQMENIASKIMILSNIQLNKNDNLPQFVCQKCTEQINNFLKFKKQIEDNHQYLLKQNLNSTSSSAESEKFEIIKDEILLSTNECDFITEEYITAADHDLPTILPENTTLNTTTTEKQLMEIKTEKPSTAIVKAKDSSQCNICGKTLSTKFRLKCHMRTHTGEKPYKCDNCNKTFALSYNLKIHQRIHTGEKPLTCNVCSKKFTQATGLISHLRLHTGENPYQCHLCPKGFKTTSHLKYHIRLHTGEKNFVCETCKRAFITQSDLSQHIKIHTGERPYICKICGIRLARAYHLDRHMLTHTGEKKFKCDICGQSYAQKYDLKRHQKIHTNTRSQVKRNNVIDSERDCAEEIMYVEFLFGNDDNKINENNENELRK